MENKEVYLTIPRRKFMREFFPELSLYQKFQGIYDEIPPQQLFAPENFILGHFIKMNNDVFVLSGARYFTDNPANLAKYNGGIDRGRIEIVRSTPASQYQIDELVWKSKRYIEYRENLGDFGAFQMRMVTDHESDLVNGILNVLDEASEIET